MSELETGALGPGRIEPRELEQEMRSSYLDYAMSVIVGRALPDVRDGLKPVHRRVLYGMHEAGLQPNRPYKKSAATVGDVMGHYHRSEEHTSELQSRQYLVCRLLLEKKKTAKDVLLLLPLVTVRLDI